MTADNRRQTAVCRQTIGHGLQAVHRPQLIKLNFKPYSHGTQLKSSAPATKKVPQLPWETFDRPLIRLVLVHVANHGQVVMAENSWVSIALTAGGIPDDRIELLALNV